MSKVRKNIESQIPEPTRARAEVQQQPKVEVDLLFGRRNYLIMIIGLGIIFLGYALMYGGNMPSPDVWDESLIYSTTRITIAPILILTGLGMQFYAIFAKKN
jgi:hypothetical protein